MRVFKRIFNFIHLLYEKEDIMKRMLLVCLMIVLGISNSSWATSYSGSLTGNGGGIDATASWDSSSTVFSWTVDNTTNAGLWTYNYTFTVPKKDISHFIIEVSPTSVAGDFSAGIFDIYNATSQGKSNPNMPGEMTGLKFQPGNLTLSASFTTTRAPVWGDFYAKDGKDGVDVTAWNTGFTSSDSDPLGAAANGSIDYHILRPDTTTVPIPGTLALLMSGLAGIGGFARRKINL
jgi:hypothetical protein